MMRPVPHHGGMTSSSPITIRRATPGDARILERIARLDSQRLPAGPHLIAEVDATPVAAIALPSGRVLADPFQATDPVITLLRERAGHLAGETPRGARTLALVRGLFPPVAGGPRPRASRSS
jgi:hypothetical protein